MKICIVAALLAFEVSGFHYLLAQEEFGQAHSLIASFWSDAQRVSAGDGAAAGDIRNRGPALIGLVEKPIALGLASYLSENPGKTPKEVEQELIRILTAGDGGTSPQTGLVDVAFMGDRSQIAVVYDINYCAVCSSSWIGVFSRYNGTYRLSSSVVNPVRNQSVHLSFLPCPASKPLLLLYGVHWGDAHSRLDMAAFSATLMESPLWSKLGLPQGKVRIESQACTITAQYLSALVRPWKEVTTTYLVSRKGLVPLKESSAPE